MKGAIALFLLSAVASSAQVKAAGPAAVAPAGPVVVEVKGARVHAADLLGAGVADVDLGVTPPLGASRVVDRAEIERAFAAASAPLPKKIPASVRISRKSRKLAAADVVTGVREALAGKPMPRGATLSAVRASAVEVPADYRRLDVELPAFPRRAGAATVHARVTFLGVNDAPLFKTLVPLDVALPPEAAFPEIVKGAAISVVVRHGLVEVSLPGVAGADADVGTFVPVTLKPSGRVLRARAIDKDHALVLEDS